MLFHSHVFLFGFLPLFLYAWHRTALSQRSRLWLLTVASYLFYGWADFRFTGLMLLSTWVDYVAGARIATSPTLRVRRGWLWVSVATNLGLLGVFKYSGFAVRNLSALSLATGGSALGVPALALPVGISFYTFQSMSYTLDLYRGRANPAASFLDFAAYVAMFPQLVAGPIVRYRDMAEQLRGLPARARTDEIPRGLWLVVLGLSKKVLVADTLAGLADPLLSASVRLDLVTSWLAMLGYSLQLYFDFSGYSDMAIGLGLLLGLELPMNFDSPYRARNVSDFWRRWHVSLSSWLRDYLYVPLGGSQSGTGRTLTNLILTMALGGLWHGAAWTFVVWGLYHGALLVILHLWSRRGVSLPGVVGQALTFLAVVLGWVFFRAADLPTALRIFQAMAGLRGHGGGSMLAAHAPLALFVVAGLTTCWLAPNTHRTRYPETPLAAAGLGLLFVAAVLGTGADSPFLYFRF